jgi:LysR family glycine cleavage system transcriptional activator
MNQLDWMHFPPLSALKSFEATVRLGGFSAAARALNVTHAAVSQQVRALEAHLGVTLVHREGRSLGFTAEGKTLGEALTAGFFDIQTTIAAIQSRNEDRPLSVTLTPAFATNWLMPRLGRFWAEHPGIAVSLRPDTQLIDLQREGVDLGIRYGQGDWSGVTSRFLASARYLIVGAPSLLGGRSDLSKNEIAKMPWVMEQDWPEQARWISCCLGLEAADLKATAFPTEDLALTAARQGYGLLIANAAVVENDVKAGKLRVVFKTDDDSTGYYIVSPTGPQRDAARKFISWLKKVA